MKPGCNYRRKKVKGRNQNHETGGRGKKMLDAVFGGTPKRNGVTRSAKKRETLGVGAGGGGGSLTEKGKGGFVDTRTTMWRGRPPHT